MKVSPGAQAPGFLFEAGQHHTHPPSAGEAGEGGARSATGGVLRLGAKLTGTRIGRRGFSAPSRQTAKPTRPCGPPTPASLAEGDTYTDAVTAAAARLKTMQIISNLAIDKNPKEVEEAVRNAVAVRLPGERF